MVNTVALSLGSNLGDREANIKEAVKLIGERFKTEIIKSEVYETPPLYYEGPELFYNCCVSFDTSLSPREIFEMSVKIEDDMGRQRSFLYAPRIIDLDVIFVGEEVVADDDLIIPHQDMENRLFVLKPLSEIMGDFVHPLLDEDIWELLDNCSDESRIELLDGFWEKK